MVPIVNASLSARVRLGSRNVLSGLLEGNDFYQLLKNDLPIHRPSSGTLLLFLDRIESIQYSAAC